MVLSKACTYGILASLYVAKKSANDKGYTSIGQMSEELNISFHFLTKILQQLTSAGILVSMKGPRGGVAFKADPSKITIFDVVVAIDGEKVFKECLLGLPDCGTERPCPVHEEWAAIRSELYETFRGKTLIETARSLDSKNLRLALPDWQR